MKQNRPWIQFDHLTIRAGGLPAFEDTSLVMETSQNWAIVGPTGSGKSLLVHALLYRENIESGRILFFPDEAGGEGQAYLSKKDAFLLSPHVQGELLCRYGGFHQARWQSFGAGESPSLEQFLSAKSMEHSSPFEVTPFRTDPSIYEQRRRRAVRLLGLRRLMKSSLISLSNGEMRKALLARAMIQGPKLLVIEDPFVGLDSVTRENFHRILDEMLSLGKPKILLVLSDSDEVPVNISHVMEIGGRRILRITGRPAGGLKIPMKKMMLETGSSGKSGRAVLLEMKNVTVAYGGRKILKNITWSVGRGERWLLLGHNGAGKSTLLSLVLGDNPQAYSNEISLFGVRRGSGESIWDIKKRIGWVSSELMYYYQSGGNCLEVVCSGFHDNIGIYSGSNTEQTGLAESAMQRAGIIHLTGRAFGSVSEGEKKLVLLARAFVKDPDLLVLDEPCQGLDKLHCGMLMGMVDKLCGEAGIALIYGTHRPDEIPGCISHLLELKEGAIARMGKIARS